VTAVISLVPATTRSAAASVIEAVTQELQLEARAGADGSWEFIFGGAYLPAHARVTAALDAADPAWPAKLILEYALVV
jgi:hypothetical protein